MFLGGRAQLKTREKSQSRLAMEQALPPTCASRDQGVGAVSRGLCLLCQIQKEFINGVRGRDELDSQVTTRPRAASPYSIDLRWLSHLS